ncbi:dynein regulatory complex subunit 5 [Cryptotermes secundus]|nr:dynein regulatory complex subunit 5 [Cryptotermes secundus]
MRVPHTIPHNTSLVYQSSEQTQNLPGEVNRTLRAEDVTWDKEIPSTLATLCVKSLASHFQEKRVLGELSEEDQCLLLETLPTDLPLTLTVPLIRDGIYWKRSSQNRWKSMNDVHDYGNSWKRHYLERHLQEHIEKLGPENFVQSEIESLVQLCSPYVKRLSIQQLQAPQPPEFIDGDHCEWPTEVNSIDHISLQPFIKGLVNLEELHVMFGVRGCGMDFAWILFKFSLVDCINIGLGLNSANCLKTFRIHRSTLDDARVSILLQHIMRNTTINRLDFSHCEIGDQGALAIGKLLTVHPALEELILCNNKIGAAGANGLACALSHIASPLKLLDLRLNHIGNQGVTDLCSALANSEHPQELILAGCGFTEETGIKLGQMLQHNTTLQALDISNNNLGEVGGEALSHGIKDNTTLLRLDYRMTGITQEDASSINMSLKSNTNRYRRKQEC